MKKQLSQLTVLILTVLASGVMASAQNLSEQEKALREDRLTFSIEVDNAMPRPGQLVTLTIKAEIEVPPSDDGNKGADSYVTNMVTSEVSTYKPENWRIVQGPGTLNAFGISPIVRNYQTPAKVGKDQEVVISVDLVSQYPNKPKIILLKTLFLADRKEFLAHINVRGTYRKFDQIDETDSHRSANGVAIKTTNTKTIEDASFRGSSTERIFRVDEYSVSSHGSENQSFSGSYSRAYSSKTHSTEPPKDFSDESTLSKSSGSITGGSIGVDFGDQGFDLRGFGISLKGDGTTTHLSKSSGTNRTPMSDDDCSHSFFAKEGCNSVFEQSTAAHLKNNRYGMTEDTARAFKPDQLQAVIDEAPVIDFKVIGSFKQGQWTGILTVRFAPKSRNQNVSTDDHAEQNKYSEMFSVIIRVTLETKEPTPDKAGAK